MSKTFRIYFIIFISLIVLLIGVIFINNFVANKALISSYETEIARYETIIGTLDQEISESNDKENINQYEVIITEITPVVTDLKTSLTEIKNEPFRYHDDANLTDTKFDDLNQNK